MTPGLRAAVNVGAAAGYASTDPVVLASSNNTVVWLRPHAVVAKVSRTADGGSLSFERAVAAMLANAGAPVAPPLPGGDGTVTLWRHLEHDRNLQADPADLARSLQEVHVALHGYGGDLPSHRYWIDAARAVLVDDAQMTALATDDLAFLRAAYDDLVAQLDRRSFGEQPLHGEPHGGNALVTPEGIRWIDFERTCAGPLEWDLAFLPDEAVECFEDVDRDLLDLLRTLTSARVATWCWARYHVPELRPHAAFHFGCVKSRTTGSGE